MTNRQTFWDQFESSIDSQENITDIDNFGYLRNLFVIQLEKLFRDLH